MSQKNLTSLFLRIGLAFIFLYAAISAFLHPQDWIGYFPNFVRQIIPESLLLVVFSSLEAILAIWLLSDKKTFYAGVISAVMLFGITVTNLEILDVTFRDVGLFFTALALTSLSRNQK